MSGGRRVGYLHSVVLSENRATVKQMRTSTPDYKYGALTTWPLHLLLPLVVNVCLCNCWKGGEVNEVFTNLIRSILFVGDPVSVVQ